MVEPVVLDQRRLIADFLPEALVMGEASTPLDLINSAPCAECWSSSGPSRDEVGAWPKASALVKAEERPRSVRRIGDLCIVHVADAEVGRDFRKPVNGESERSPRLGEVLVHAQLLGGYGLESSAQESPGECQCGLSWPVGPAAGNCTCCGLDGGHRSRDRRSAHVGEGRASDCCPPPLYLTPWRSTGIRSTEGL